MRFFFPDSQDFVDPSFDFIKETRSETRIRQRDDVYPHELFETPPYDGILVSMAIVYGNGSSGGKYSMAQGQRLLREGVRGFFRLSENSITDRIATMGDCGAFSYVREDRPPFTVDDVIDFYEQCGFDYGLSVDHVIPVYDPLIDEPSLRGIIPDETKWRDRQQLSLKLAEEFRSRHDERGCRFEPIGVAQGWSPASYATAVEKLQCMDYEWIALGGMVPLKTVDIMSCLSAIDNVRLSSTKLHLLGVTRQERLREFQEHGVASFDSTSPLRRAFKDDRDNYYASGRNYVAIRVPQVEASPRLKRRIVAGQVDGREARRLEQACLQSLRLFDKGKAPLEDVLETIVDYERLHGDKRSRAEEYRVVLETSPWKECPCDVCRRIGIEVILFRGAERNRRRGFHNLFVFSNRLRRDVDKATPVVHV